MLCNPFSSQQLLNEIQPFSSPLMTSETTGSLVGWWLGGNGFALKILGKGGKKAEQLENCEAEMKSSFHVSLKKKKVLQTKICMRWQISPDLPASYFYILCLNICCLDPNKCVTYSYLFIFLQ